MGHPIKYLTITIQNCQDYQNKETVRNYHSQQEPKETKQVNAVPWIGFWNTKRHCVKNSGNLNKL